MYSYRHIFIIIIAFHITVTSFAGQKRDRPVSQELFGSAKRFRIGQTQDDLDKQLFVAVQGSNRQLLESLLRDGANVNAQNYRGQTPLHIASQRNDQTLMYVLWRAGANVNAQDFQGETPLHYAAHSSSLGSIKLLAEAKADKEIRNNHDWPALHLAVRNNRKEVVVALLSAGANANTEGRFGYTPLHCAAEGGYTNLISVLKEAGSNVNIPLENGWTPLHLASKENHGETVTALCGIGANAHAVITANRYTPLHMAAQNDSSEAIIALLKAGAHIHARTVTDRNPLHEAAMAGKVNAIVTLCRYGINVNARSSGTWTALHLAAHDGREQAVHALLNAGADTEVSRYRLGTPLSCAARYGFWRIMCILLRRGADPMPLGLNTAEHFPLEQYYLLKNRSDAFVDILIQEHYIHTLARDGSMIPVTADNGDTVLHRILSRKLALGQDCHDYALQTLVLKIVLHDTSRVLDVSHKNMYGYNVLHTGSQGDPQRLVSLLGCLLSGKTKEEKSVLLKATTPYGETLCSLAPQLREIFSKRAMPSNTWTPLMRLAYNTTVLTTEFQEALERDTNPAYVTDTYDSALSVARCEEVKGAIREVIRQKRRNEILTMLKAKCGQSEELADLMLTFGGTYEPPLCHECSMTSEL